MIELFHNSSETDIKLIESPDLALLGADKDMMVRVFNNLIKNAVQATSQVENGAVLISIIDQPEKILIEIRDNGIGIDPDQKEKIFVPYFTTKSTGTGLGLAMVKQMVELHKGQIYFDSILGEGTTFYVEFRK